MVAVSDAPCGCLVASCSGDVERLREAERERAEMQAFSSFILLSSTAVIVVP